MFSLNSVKLIGYQTQPLELRQTPNGTSVTDLNLLVPSRVRTENDQEITVKSFHTVTLWGPMAEVASQFVRPGSQVFVSGRLQTDSWEDPTSHEKRSKTKVSALGLILLDPREGKTDLPKGAEDLHGTLNHVDLIGNVTRDPELRRTPTGQSVLTLGLATNDRWKDKLTGEQRERAEFHAIVLWGNLASKVSDFVRKGMRVFVSGRLQSRSFLTKDGSKRAVTEVVAETCSLLGFKHPVASDLIHTEERGESTPSELPTLEGEEEVPAPLPDVPAMQYASEIRVEDLPF